jgi:hypothetical protein
MRGKKINRTNISNHLLEYQLGIIDKNMIDMLSDHEWFNTWTMTTAQLGSFRGYAIPLLKKTFKFNKDKAETTFKWFLLQYGLRIED